MSVNRGCEQSLVSEKAQNTTTSPSLDSCHELKFKERPKERKENKKKDKLKMEKKGR